MKNPYILRLLLIYLTLLYAKKISFKMKTISHQNDKNTFLLEIFGQAKHKFAKALGFPEAFIQLLQLVKKTNPLVALICSDMSGRGELGYMFPFAHSKPFYEVSNFSKIISNLR